MEYDPKDIDVVNLIKKLKEANGAYPQEMLALRRQGYLRQVAEIAGGAGLAMGLRDAAKGGNGSGLTPTAGTVIEALLVVAIVAESGAVAYFYRDKITEILKSGSIEPSVVQVTEPPVVSSPISEIISTPTPVFTLSATETSIGTPSLEVAADPTLPNGAGGSNNAEGDVNSAGGNPAVATPNANENNGNQYGLTPKPDRTREPGNETSEENQETQPNSRRNK